MKILTLSIALLAAASLSAQTQDTRETKTEEGTQNPRAQDDGSWIAISGEVKSVGNDQFSLDYGDGSITVHLENDDTEASDYEMLKGEQVRVYGIVDERFLRGTAILARAVFVESMSTYVYATDGAQEFIRVSTPGIASGTVVQGTVTNITDDKIMLDKGDRMLTVDTSTLTNDETGENGLENVAVGDQIAIVGNMGREFFTARTLRASSIMPLNGAGEIQGSDREY